MTVEFVIMVLADDESSKALWYYYSGLGLRRS
jgi:hypothetical protein